MIAVCRALIVQIILGDVKNQLRALRTGPLPSPLFDTPRKRIDKLKSFLFPLS
jgi:hypothetical protein